MHPFEKYLRQHNLEALKVSLTAKVRYMTVWNATRGNPITPKHAKQIREAVLKMTKDPYMDQLVLTKPIEEISTIPIKKIPRHNPN
jgi:hypothetical protein